MNLYSIYGACLASSMPLPELRSVENETPKWTFETTPQLEPMHDAVELGADLIYDAVYARLYRHSTGHRIVVDDTGEFDLALGAKHIRWQERAESWPDFVRAHLIGRVLATSLFLDGWLPLHGSAVAFDDGVVAFLAPKGFGKSSLAIAVTHAGGRLVTDDTLPVELSAVPRAWPGVHAVRVHADSLTALGAPTDGVATREGKTMITDIPAEQLVRTAAPLRALYILVPVVGGSIDTPAARAQLPETLAALSVVSHVKIASMLGPSAAPTLLDSAATLVHRVPTYQLAVPRDLSSLADTAACIASWHTGTGKSAGAPGSA